MFAGNATLVQTAYQFEGKEWIAPRTFNNVLAHLRGKIRRQLLDEVLRQFRRKRLQGQGSKVLASASPGWSAIQQFRAAQDNQQQACMCVHTDHMLYQVEHTI